MYYFVCRYLSAFQLGRYILTLPLYYINSMLPAFSLYCGAWIAEHPIPFQQLVILMLFIAFLHLLFGKGAIYHQKVLYTSIHQAGKRLRMDLMEVMIKNREVSVDSSAQLNDVEKVEENLFLGGVDLVEQVLFYLLAFSIVFYINPWIAFFLLALSLLVSIINAGSRKKGKFYQAQNSFQQKKQLEFLEQTELGYETIWMYQQQDRMEQQFQDYAEELCTIQGNLDWNQEKNQIITMVFLLASGSFSVLAGSYFIKSGALTLAQLLVIVQCSNYLFKPIQRIMTAWFQVKSIQETVEKLDKILAAADTMDHCKKEEAFYTSLQWNHTLELKLQDFFVGQKKILKSVAFTIQKGEKVLLLGANGCGKTTLLNYLLGHYGYQKGSLWIDGKDSSQFSWDMVSQIFAPVDQNFFLLSGTVKENICCFQDLPDSVLEASLSLCHIKEIADREEVLELSGGQMQRVAIARAVASQRKVMVLDEAFRAVDAENMIQMEQSLLQIPELTIMEVSHRISKEIYWLFDKVILIKQGEIEQIGTPQQLLFHPFVQNLIASESSRFQTESIV